MMKKLFLLVIVAGLTIFLSACQIHQTFVVTNDSEREITLEYTVKETASRRGEIVNPHVESTEESKWFSPKEWIPMPEARYHFDEKERKFTFKLNPEESVVIERKDSFYVSRDGIKAINLINLRIKDNGKEIYFEDTQRLFDEFKTNKFEIIYK